MSNTDARNREEISPANATESTNDQQLQAEGQTATHEDIEKQAYAIYVKNGCQGGDSDKDWYQAERELGKEIVQQNRATEKMVDEGSPVPEVDPASLD